MVFIPLHDDNPLERIRRPWAAWSIIAVTTLVFLGTRYSGTDGIEAAAFSFGVIPAVTTGRATLAPGLVEIPAAANFLTYAFLHAGWLHLVGNMAFVFVFGDNIEDAMGRVRFVLFYLVCAAAAAAVHVLAAPASTLPLVGASGAVAGIIGAYLVLHPRVKLWVLAFGRIPIRLPAAWILGAWVALQVWNVATDTAAEVAWWAHLGGLATGAALVVLMRRPGVALFDREPPAAR